MLEKLRSIWPTISDVQIDISACGTFECWLNRYQSLIAGMLALIGALLTVRWMRKQIDNDKELAEQEFQRLREASRAMLPFALREITAYAHSCMSVEFAILKQIDEFKRCEIFDPVPLPKAALERIETTIKTSKAEVQAGLADLLLVTQIQSSRFAALCLKTRPNEPRTVPTKNNVYVSLAATLETQGLAEEFYKYARRDEFDARRRARASLPIDSDVSFANQQELANFLSRWPLICDPARALVPTHTGA